MISSFISWWLEKTLGMISAPFSFPTCSVTQRRPTLEIVPVCLGRTRALLLLDGAACVCLWGSFLASANPRKSLCPPAFLGSWAGLPARFLDLLGWRACPAAAWRPRWVGPGVCSPLRRGPAWALRPGRPASWRPAQLLLAAPLSQARPPELAPA